jgi:hypothetical protein
MPSVQESPTHIIFIGAAAAEDDNAGYVEIPPIIIALINNTENSTF